VTAPPYGFPRSRLSRAAPDAEPVARLGLTRDTVLRPGRRAAVDAVNEVAWMHAGIFIFLLAITAASVMDPAAGNHAVLGQRRVTGSVCAPGGAAQPSLSADGPASGVSLIPQDRG
jgi:hypothetical protein